MEGTPGGAAAANRRDQARGKGAHAHAGAVVLSRSDQQRQGEPDLCVFLVYSKMLSRERLGASLPLLVCRVSDHHKASALRCFELSRVR